MEINDLDDDLELDEEKEYNTSINYVTESLLEESDDDDDDLEGNLQEQFTTRTEGEEEDIISSLLRQKGITDPTKIKFENEDGEIEELDWNSLSRDEQMNILNTQDDDNDLDDEEIDFLNRLRLSNISPAQYTEMIRQLTIQAFNQQLQNSGQAPAKTYQIDDLSDDELFVLDMQARVEGVTDEELADALEKAKEDEDFYKKQIAGIRNEYKKLEDSRIERETALMLQLQQENYAQFANTVADAIYNFNSVGELDVNLNDDDMNDLYLFITGVDQQGVNHFAKAVNDPETLVKMAWFALNGDDVLNSISEYYKLEIQKAHKAGIEQGKKSVANKKTNKVVIDKKQSKTEKQNSRKSVNDLDID